MAYRVELAFRRAAEPLLPAGASILAAVSGGSDSMALLDLLARWAPGRGLRLTVAHLDHGLRRGSRGDRTFVERAARALDLPFLAERVATMEHKRRDESVEEAARRVRLAFLRRSAKKAGCERIATGHTLDDQAETILMRLVRGAGATALAGMAEEGPGPFVRPLLGLTREELCGYLSRRGVEYREDPSNRDLRFDRNRTRLRVLPFLREHLNPQVGRHLVKAAERLREDAVFLDGLAERKLKRNVRSDETGRITLEAERLVGQPAPIAKRMARLILLRAGVDPRRVATRHVDSLLDLAAGGSGRSLDLPGGVRARRARKRLILER